MQENNFEKQVRKLMEDLEITPREPVWEYVEKRIPKSNRRRRFIAFFLLFAGVTVCGYFSYNKFSGNSKINTYNKIVTTLEQSDKSSNENPGNKATGIQPSLIDTSTTVINSLNSKTTEVVRKEGSPESNKILSETKKEVKQFNSKSETIFSPALPVAADKKEENTLPIDNVKNETTIISEPTITPDSHDNTDTSNSSTAIKDNTDGTKENTLTTNNAAPEKKELKKINTNYKKLQWGVTGFYGRSNIVQSFVDGIGISESDKSLADYGAVNPGTNLDSVASASYSKVVTAKSAYSIGFIVKKQISARSSIRTGIQYTHLKTQIKTGEAKDTSAVFNYNNSDIATRLYSYYRPGLGSTKINKYSLVQIPFVYSYQFNKGKSFPLVVDAGFSLSRVISSDALVYDSYNQAYYKNPDLFNKTQITLSGGIHTNLSFIHKGSLELGPQLQYGLTNLVKNNNTQQHLFIWGLNATYFLQRKK